MTPFDEFVREIILHNELADPTAVESATKMLKLTKDKTLFEILVQRGLVDADLETDIDAMWADAQASAPEVHDEGPPPVPGEPGGGPPPVPDGENVNYGSDDIIDSSGEIFNCLNDYLAFARRIGASDFHMAADAPPLVRYEGELKPISTERLSPETTERLLYEILDEEQARALTEDQDYEFCYKVPNSTDRYRASMVKQRLGYDGAFRIIDTRVPTMEELGLPDVLRKLTEYHQGLVLITGPNGCGKSSTMAAMVELINETRDEHIITIEDPIEFVFEPKQAQINQREAGTHTRSFSNALRAALREDPDIIMIGELRDKETISLAITAAETGHLVLGTLHTTSAARTIDRLLDVFPPSEQGQIRTMISESIKGIICQQLVARADGKGRTLALEILFNTPACASNIRERKLHQLPSVMQMGKKQGMVLLDNSLEELVGRGIITGEEAYYAAIEKDRFEEYAPLFI